MEEAMKGLLMKPQTGHRLGTRRQIAEKEFSIERFERDLLEFLQIILTN